MTEAATPSYSESDAAPFVYFDMVATYGVLHGVIQIELVSRVLTNDDGAVKVSFLTTGRLRCSPTAAGHLRDAITKALEMLSQSPEAPAAVGALNRSIRFKGGSVTRWP
jgi:hypothetical protein